MRVIAGSAGGLRLEVPRHGVRPTMDRVKGAIFSSLGSKVVGARILDLFAGTGGLGIEALSRGAGSVIFVESNRVAASAIERNLATAKFSARVRIQDVFDFLRHTTEQVDIIFADPPYERTAHGERFTELLLRSDPIARLLVPGGIFVIEKRPEEQLPAQEKWNVTKAKRYGATEVLFLAKAE